jgi:hypothetical protein
MKRMSLLVAMMIAMPLFAQAKAISCRGEDRGGIGIKLIAKGDMKEKDAFGQTFAVGEFTFKITEPGKPVWEVTLPLAIPTYPSMGYVSIANDEGGYLYEEGASGNDPRQLDVRELLTWGHYVSYRSPAIGGREAKSVLINVSCTGFKF